jgi:hypothetical protein
VQAGDVGVGRQQQPQHPGQVEGAFDQVAPHQFGPGGGGVAGAEQQVHDG